MIEFESVRIGELGTVITGRTPKTSVAEYYGNDFMFVGPTDLHKHYIISNSEKMISKSGLTSIKSATIDGLSICVGCIGWDMGNVGLFNGIFATNQQINTITKIKSDYNPYYIYYWLKGKKEYLFQQASVTRTPILNKSSFSNIEIEIPIKAYQDNIADVLTSIDKKIELNNKINTELEAMAKLIYDYWFVQFDFPSDSPENKGKPYKSSGGKMVYNEELKREIPEGWKVKPLIEEMDVQYGYPFSTKLFNEDQEGSPVVRIRNVLDNSITMYSTENADDKYLIKKGDILVGMDGNFHINFWGKDGCYLNQRCVRIRKKKSSFFSHFQAKFQIEPYVKAREKNVSRTTVGHLSAKDINDLNVLVPCSKKVIQGMTTFDSLLEKVIINRNENSKLVELRDWLLPMLMNGQVTVKNTKEK